MSPSKNVVFTRGIQFLFCFGNNLMSFRIFGLLPNCCSYWYYWFLPQQFLYFFPLPHVLTPRILLVFIIFIILSVFVGVTRQCTFGIYHIISTYSIYNISLRMSNRCHWHLTKILIYSLLIKQFIYLIFIYHGHYNNKKEEKSIF